MSLWKTLLETSSLPAMPSRISPGLARRQNVSIPGMTSAGSGPRAFARSVQNVPSRSNGLRLCQKSKAVRPGSNSASISIQSHVLSAAKKSIDWKCMTMADHMADLPSLPFSSRTRPSFPRDSEIGQYSAESRSFCTSAVQ